MLISVLAVPLDASAATSKYFAATGILGSTGNSSVTLTVGGYDVKSNTKAIYVKKVSADKWIKICKDKPTSVITNGKTIYYSKVISQSDEFIKSCSVYKMDIHGNNKTLVYTAFDNSLGYYPGLSLVTKYGNDIYYNLGPLSSNYSTLYKFNEKSKTASLVSAGQGFYYNGRVFKRPGDQALLVNTSTKYFSVKTPDTVKTLRDGAVCQPFYNSVGSLYFYSYKWSDDITRTTSKYIYWYNGSKLQKSKKLPNKYYAIGKASKSLSYVIVKDANEEQYRFYLKTGTIKAV